MCSDTLRKRGSVHRVSCVSGHWGQSRSNHGIVKPRANCIPSCRKTELRVSYCFKPKVMHRSHTVCRCEPSVRGVTQAIFEKAFPDIILQLSGQQWTTLMQWGRAHIHSHLQNCHCFVWKDSVASSRQAQDRALRVSGANMWDHPLAPAHGAMITPSKHGQPCNG